LTKAVSHWSKAAGKPGAVQLPNGEKLDFPMSPHLAVMRRSLGQPD
jgi:hypothetical protein